ncbi:MAG: hypothetical protein ACQGVK_16535 [Myxococcota bacterium]
MTFEELAWEFVEVFDELDVADINTMLAKNVPMEKLEFFNAFAEQFAKQEGLVGDTGRRLPNLMLIGYILRILEERLPVSEPTGD